MEKKHYSEKEIKEIRLKIQKGEEISQNEMDLIWGDIWKRD